MQFCLPAISQLNLRKHAPALLGIFVLALFQISSASHQFEHVSDHGFTACEVCTATNQLDDAPIPVVSSIAVAVERRSTSHSGTRAAVTTPFPGAYHSRAPPHS